MFKLDTLREKFASSLGARPAAADMTTVRMFCEDLLLDVPSSQRNAMLVRLETMRRATDLWHLRSALFDVVARHHGEQVAALRLRELDGKLRPFAAPKPRGG